MKIINLIVAIFFLFSACATHQTTATRETADMLDSRIGYMTYDEALQMFGPPTQCADGIYTKTCTWVYGSGGAIYMPLGGTLLEFQTPPSSATLTFTNGVLSNWQLKGRWK